MVDPPRARDWSPLTDDGSDPVPGDWEAVKEAAERYRNMADLIQRCSDTLDSVHEDSQTWVGQTADAFRERSTDLSDSVIRAKGRYAAAADALEEYWPELKSAQEDSEELRSQAVTEQDTLDTYGPLASESEDEDADNHDEHQDYQDQIDTANATIQSLRDQLATIVDDKDRAAQRAADAINEFIDNDGLKNSSSLWGAFQDFMATVGEWAGAIAAIAGVLSIFLGWVPFLGQALAFIAIAGTALSLLGNVVNGEWGAAAMDVLGLATGGIVSALGRTSRMVSTANRLRGYDDLVRAGRGTVPAIQRVSSARTAVSANRRQLMDAASDAASQAPRSVGDFVRQVGRQAWDDLTFRGGGAYSLVGRGSDVTDVAAAGQRGLTLQASGALGAMAAIQGFSDYGAITDTIDAGVSVAQWADRELF
ncbi:putative T7SS-secreted protein [Streptomyces sp. 6N223]|uniref:putative T7SS-secreted protein n=1 Tax=Streptomyces sp. 6N223 TaxID=3457412 RepID=UPI003FD36C15